MHEYKKESPLYGMPILNADKAHTVMVLKRSLRPGFAGEDNELFYQANTMMVFGDAKAMLTSLVQLIKQAQRPGSTVRKGTKETPSPSPREFQATRAAK